MKRSVCVILAALLVLVLAMPAAAAEVYEFEYMEIPAALSESFDFSEYDSMLIYEGILPPGVYDGSLTDGDTVFSFGAPVSLAFDMYDPGSGYWGTFAIVQLLDAGVAFDVPMAFVLMDGVTVVLSGGLSSGSTLTLTRVGDLSSDSGSVLSGFLDTMKTGLQDYNITNLGTILVFALILACSPALCWFGYRFIKRKFTKAYFKGRV